MEEEEEELVFEPQETETNELVYEENEYEDVTMS